MSVTFDTPDDMPEFDLTELERYLAAQAPTDPPPDPAPPAAPGPTRRVRKLASRVAEARQLAALQGASVLVTVHTPRVLRTIQRGSEAIKLVQLRRNPAFAALATVRARRFVTTTGLAALVLALGWSTAGVQAFAANNAPRFSAMWWSAWAVEPVVSLALLTIVIARAFLASRGQPLTVATVRRVEWLFLGMTLLMNTWLHLPGVAHPFQFGQLIIHALGPITAVCVVTVLPLLWAAIDHAPLPAAPMDRPPSQHDTTTPPMTAAGRGHTRIADALARAVELIRSGHLPAHPSANQIHKALGGAMDTARAVRDALRNNQ